MTPSPYQKQIFTAVETTTHSLSIQAVAGSGKTTTLVEIASRLPRHQTNIFLAFNAKIASELETRLPYFCKASTFHSFCKQQLGKIRVEPKKLLKLHGEYNYDLFQAVGLVKANMTKLSDAKDKDFVSYIVANADVDKVSVEAVQQLLLDSLSNRKTMDFDDMLCFALDADFPVVHNLCIDEAQDLSPVQHAILKRIAPKRLIAVGDPAQAIYGFRGALSSSMEELEITFNLVRYPLSICYRCSRAVVEHANKELNHHRFQCK
jgi:superfamily I DNA/RNA helicase